MGGEFLPQGITADIEDVFQENNLKKENGVNLGRLRPEIMQGEHGLSDQPEIARGSEALKKPRRNTHPHRVLCLLFRFGELGF